MALESIRLGEKIAERIEADRRAAQEMEFGEFHLLDTLESHSHLPVGPLLQAVVGAFRQFSSDSDQQDNITLGDCAVPRLEPVS